MLDDQAIERIARPLLEIGRQIEWDLIKNIISRININDKIGGTAIWEIEQLRKLGGLHADNLKVIAKYTNRSVNEIKTLIRNAAAGVIDMTTLSKAFDQGHISVDPSFLEFENIIETFEEALTGEWRMIMTGAISHSTNQYQQLVDKVTFEATAGIKSYDQALIDGINQLSDQGITAVQYVRMRNGIPQIINYSTEASVRRSIMTAINQTANNISRKVVEELEPEYILTSQHYGARNVGHGYANHESWQGKVFKNDGEFERETGFLSGDMLGLAGYNCRHQHHPYFPGISPEPPPRLDPAENDRVYKAEQRQRLLERRVRESKKRVRLAEMTEDKDYIKKEKKMLKRRLTDLSGHVKDNNLVRQYAREQIPK